MISKLLDCAWEHILGPAEVVLLSPRPGVDSPD